jgi:Domain of unknown function (DUF4145)
MAGPQPHSKPLTRAARLWLGKFLKAELAGAPLEALVWRAGHAKDIPACEELLQRRRIERQDQSHYVVTLLGLDTAPGASAQSALAHCERVFAALRKHYSQDPKHPILVSTLAKRTRLSVAQVLQSARFLQRSPAYLSIHGDPKAPSLFPQEPYVTLSGFAGLLEQARSQPDLTAPQPLLSITELDGLAVAPLEPPPNSAPRETAGHCPQCGPDRMAIISSQHVERWQDNSVSGSETYNILTCRGCGAIYYQRLSECSEDRDYAYGEHGETLSFARPKISYWPAPVIRPTPPWVEGLADAVLRNVLQEVYGALNADHRTLAAVGARTVLDRAMTLLQAPEGDTFEGKLKHLVQQQIISQHDRDILGALTDAGSASAHRGWRPTPEQLITIMEGVENFLHRMFVVGAAATAMKAQVPPRPPRNKAPKSTP